MTASDRAEDAARRKALVLQHASVEHTGSIGERLTERGFDLVTVELDQGEAIPRLGAFDLMLVMGGPMDVWEEERYPWLRAEKRAIQRWVVGPPLPWDLPGTPAPGGGHGRVGPMPAPEVGQSRVELTADGLDDRILALGGPGLPVLQWHGSEVKVPPPASTVLATSAACQVQAIHVPPRAWGLQFHVEVQAGTVGEWAAVPEYHRSLDTTVEGGIAGLAAAVRAELPAMQRLAATLADRLADLGPARPPIR